MKIEALGVTDQGETREKNEDAFGIFEDEQFYVLADGVGGHLGGEVAALETVNQLYYGIQRVYPRLKECSEKEIQSLLKFNISETNQIVINKGNTRQELKGMASTFCFLFIFLGSVYYSHYGDSRIYLLREGELKLLTKDHTIAQELEDANKAITHKRQKSTLTKAIGVVESERASVKVEPILPSDKFFICSDGLLEGLGPKEIKFYLTQNKDPKTILQEIILDARNRGSKDNITAILIKAS